MAVAADGPDGREGREAEREWNGHGQGEQREQTVGPAGEGSRATNLIWGHPARACVGHLRFSLPVGVVACRLSLGAGCGMLDTGSWIAEWWHRMCLRSLSWPRRCIGDM